MSVSYSVTCGGNSNQNIFFWIVQVHWAPWEDKSGVAVTVWGPSGQQIAYSEKLTANTNLPFKGDSVNGKVTFDGAGLNVSFDYSESGQEQPPFPIVNDVFTECT